MRSPEADKPISEAEADRLFGGLDVVRGIALAVSGGPDSTALLWLVARWIKGLETPPKLIALTVDHGLRTESAREARAVARLAKVLGVEHRTLRWTGRKPKTGIQEAARNARYRLLAQATHDAGAMHLVTAHTLDDQAETVLFRMARGSGIAGLAGMRRFDAVPVPDAPPTHLVRPLLTIAKARLIATLNAAKVPYATDPSNVDPRFARPRFRALMPLLEREGLTAERLGKLAARVERVEDTLFKILNRVQADLWPDPWSDGEPATIDAEAFLDLPQEIGLRLLQRMINLIGNEGPVELGQLETLHADLRASGEGIWLGVGPDPVRRTLAGALVTLRNTKLTVERAPPRRIAAKRPKSVPKTPFTKRR
jgi:tRNA(Ile)-lysidine synthase